jgi:hypothetical protein
LLFIATTLIALGLGLSIKHTRGNIEMPEATQDQKLTFSPAYMPSSKPSIVLPSLPLSVSIRNEIERNVLQRNVTFDGMEVTKTRFLALDWITDKDQMRLIPSDSKLIQRYILALLGFEF